jgi:imidazole glycerol-phosphate synthase subunit HisF
VLIPRLIACLDVDGGRVVKGTRFLGLRDAGDPAELAARYDADGADEVVLLDITATHQARGPLLEVVRRAAVRLSVPLTVGGGLRSVEDVTQTLRAGADKVALNSAAFTRPELVSECAARFGSQCVVASIDARATPQGWEVVIRGGREATGRDAIGWAQEMARRGAGEVLLTCIDRDGARSGYELALVRAVAGSVDVPVVASGGAGSAEHVRLVLTEAGADAALLAGILHDGTVTLGGLKRELRAGGIPVRGDWP